MTTSSQQAKTLRQLLTYLLIPLDFGLNIALKNQRVIIIDQNQKNQKQRLNYNSYKNSYIRQYIKSLKSISLYKNSFHQSSSLQMQELSENPPICPLVQGNNIHQWCTFQMNNPPTAIAEYVYFSCVIVIGIVLCRFICVLTKYRRNNRYKQYFGNMYIGIYTIVGLWVLFTFFRVLLCIIVYNLFMIQDFPLRDPELHKQDPQIKSLIVMISCLYNFFNSLTGFLINFAMVLIPYQWIKIQLEIVNQSQLLEQQDRKKINLWMGIVNIARIYFKYVRNAFPVLQLIQPILFYLMEFYRCRWVSVNLFFIICEAILFMFFYIFGGYVSYYFQKKQLIKMEPKQARRIKTEYLALFIVLVARITRNFLTVQKIITSKDMRNGNCSNITDYPLGQLLNLCIYHSFMHLLPICIILYIYQPNIKKLKKYEDLMDIDSTSEFEGQSNYKAIAREFFKASLVSENRSSASDKSSNQILLS